jgi:serine/threonine protein kinase
MGGLWLVEQRGQEGVLKEVRADHAGNPAFQVLLERETEALRRLRHPAVIVLLDAGPGWLVVERAQFSAAERPPQDAHGLQELLGRVGQALEHAHARGIVHRDVKASNVLWTHRGWVLADFGAARIEGLSDPAPGLGSPPWMSPARLAGAPATPADDLHALGITAWELATGSVPYPSRWEELLAAVERGLPPFRPRYPVPEALQDRIGRWLAGR